MKQNIVLFDLDDTLVIEEPSAEESIKASSIIAQKKYGIDPNKLHKSVRTHARELWRSMPTYQYCNDIGISSWEGLWAKFIGENENLRKLNKLADYYQTTSWYNALLDFYIDDKVLANRLSKQFYIDRRKRHILFPETLEILNKLKEEYRLGLITNGLPELQWEKIRGAGIEDYFEYIIISGDVNIKKPNKEIFLIAVEKFRTVKKNCIMVGNSLNSDIFGAKNAGIFSVWINRSNKKIDKKIIPDKTISNLVELPELLQNLFK
ncbi:MAG: HAD family hydrolase [Promethearchaeota archaeon]|jgi:putative hydrolase of the HAD superfamily